MTHRHFNFLSLSVTFSSIFSLCFSSSVLVLDKRDNLLFKLPPISTRSLQIPTRAWDCDCDYDFDDDDRSTAAIEEGGGDGGGGGAKKLATPQNWQPRVWPRAERSSLTPRGVVDGLWSSWSCFDKSGPSDWNDLNSQDITVNLS